MAKITSQTKAQELTVLRRRKINEAFSALRAAACSGRGKLNYALHFWLGAESVSWFMKRNDLDPSILQAQFDDLGAEAFAEREQTLALAEQVAAAEARFLADVDEIVKQTGV